MEKEITVLCPGKEQRNQSKSEWEWLDRGLWGFLSWFKLQILIPKWKEDDKFSYILMAISQKLT